MPSSLNLAGVFSDAISEHITIIRRLEAQQDVFERAAVLITEALSAATKCCGAATAAAPLIRSIWPPSWWAASGAGAPDCLP